MKVWVTRSRPGADRLAAELAVAGVDAVVAPVLSIEPIAAAPPQGAFDVVIFLSEHAVRHAQWVAGCGGACAQARVLAVGARTAAALAAHGVRAATGDEASTEGLLESRWLADVTGRAVLIVCGAGGRRLLAETLQRRGAIVVEHVCYRRLPARALPEDVGTIDAILVSSGDGFEQVARLWFEAGGRADVPVLVPSRRVAGRGPALGFARVIECAGATGAAYLEALRALDARAAG